jgi:hypothetical protein
MNALLEAVITSPELRDEQAMIDIAADSADQYLPWSDEVE